MCIFTEEPASKHTFKPCKFTSGAVLSMDMSCLVGGGAADDDDAVDIELIAMWTHLGSRSYWGSVDNILCCMTVQ